MGREYLALAHRASVTLRGVMARLAQAVATIFLVATLTFLAVHLAPGDPLQALNESPRVNPSDVSALRRQYHLDDPVPVQYVRYLVQLGRGDLGYSFGQHRPVAAAIAEAMPATLELALGALVIMFGLGLVLGVYQGAHAGSPADRALSAASLTLYAVPAFWLALLLILVFAQALHWLPASGATGESLTPTFGAALVDRLRHLVLPASTLGVVGAAYVARFQREATRDARHQPFVRAARAKGLSSGAVLWRHVAANALLPAIALAGIELPGLLSGVVVVESVFGWPGLGRVAADAIFQRDYPLVTGAALLTATLVVLGNLAADALARVADPRLRVAA